MKNNIHGREDYVNGRIDLTAIIVNIKAGFARLFWIPVAAAIIGGGLLSLNSWINYTPAYTAGATFTIEVNYGVAYTADYYNSAAAKNMAAVFPYIFQSTQLSEMVAEDLEIEGALPVSVTAEVLQDTNLFTLNVTAAEPQLAYNALKSIIRNYPKISERVVGSTTMKLIDEPAVPAEPSNRAVWIDSAKKGAAAGLVLGIIFIFVYALTRNTVQDTKYLSRRINVSCLGKIKQLKTKKYRKTKAALITINNEKTDYSFKESFRVIRTRMMRRLNDCNAKTVMITSTFPGEGKTTVAINLALSLAETGKKVILVDCDLRKASVLENIKELRNATHTVEDYINGEAELERCMYHVKDTSLYIIPNRAKMYDSASEVIGSEAMRNAINGIKQQADYVIIDSSPMDMMADAAALSQVVDASVFVVRYNYGKARYVLKAAKELMESPAVMIGYIFNGIEDYAREYGYGGKYSHYSSYGKYGAEK